MGQSRFGVLLEAPGKSIPGVTVQYICQLYLHDEIKVTWGSGQESLNLSALHPDMSEGELSVTGRAARGHLLAHINITQDHRCLVVQDLTRNNSDLDRLLVSHEVWGLSVNYKSSARFSG